MAEDEEGEYLYVDSDSGVGDIKIIGPSQTHGKLKPTGPQKQEKPESKSFAKVPLEEAKSLWIQSPPM